MSGLKALIAVTCLVVIGGVGYFIVSDMNAKKANDEREAQHQKEQVCEDRARAMEAGHSSGDDLLVLIDCTNNGAMTQERMNSAISAVGRRINGG
ncbi:hypothetical protein [Rhizobium phaseoli]|uniref:hypothetical protein n=1 Tax=Rhizobium phaseoli TaxID=396 RepID=UPI00035C1759|nr:hypothetical protein [Rhizobium phaseoli]KKZ89071.1 hypothetical protein RPHASCH2410_CH00310 [Rhizobium phaseoli Ch24-10]